MGLVTPPVFGFAASSPITVGKASPVYTRPTSLLHERLQRLSKRALGRSRFLDHCMSDTMQGSCRSLFGFAKPARTCPAFPENSAGGS